jgi:hypothetical protein
MKMSEERQLQIFSKFDENANCYLNMQEFIFAMDYIRNHITKNTMSRLGFTRENIIRTLLVLIIILLLMFVFIFFGIMGFTTNSTMGSVVNALMPIIAGGILGKSSQETTKEKIKQIQPEIERVLRILTIENI